jgi:hypothetical protein
MNYASFIVKIIEKSEQSFFDNNTSVTEFLVKCPQIRSNDSGSIFQISVWQTSTSDNIEYYQVNDYIVIEGYISFRENLIHTSNFQTDNLIEISIFKIYPFLLNKTRTNFIKK